MNLAPILKWLGLVCAGLLVGLLALQGAGALDLAGGDQEFKLEGNAAVSNYGAAEVEETPDDTWGYRIAEVDADVSRSIMKATALRADGKIKDAEWPCVKKAFDRLSSDLEASREAYEVNPAVAVYLADRIQKDLAQINAEINKE